MFASRVRMPADLQLKAMNMAHHVLLTLSGGRLGWWVGGMPVLELTTTGRRSGRRRTVMLTSPLREGGAIVVVASRGGDDRHPAWFLNLRDHPDVEVAFAGEQRQAMRARVAIPAERAALWPRVVSAHTRYAEYQARTDREIPLVLLEPVGGTSGSSRLAIRDPAPHRPMRSRSSAIRRPPEDAGA